jgi:ribosome recycling factor
MNLEARKIEFLKDFLTLQSEEVITQLEKILIKEKNHIDTDSYEPMTIKQLDERINQSELDFNNNNFKNSSSLLAKYE